MPNKIIVIYTDDTKPRRYISSISKRDQVVDNNLLAETTTDKNQAHDFETVANAEKIIGRIHNPFDRTYKHDKIAVTYNIPSGSSIVKGDMY